MNTSIKSRRAARLSALALALSSAFAAHSAWAGCYMFSTETQAWLWIPEADDDEGTSHGSPNETCHLSSFAYGAVNNASSLGSSAFGFGNISAGEYSSAFGMGNQSFGESNAAFGYRNKAGLQTNNFIFASAFGTENTAAASWSNAFGHENRTYTPGSSAFGINNEAAFDSDGTGSNASLFGHSNYSSGEYGNAFGHSNYANGNYSAAFGDDNNAFGAQSSAFGVGNRASGSQSVAMGFQNNNTFSDGSVMPSAGLYSVAMGHRNSASGESSIAVGAHNRAEGTHSSVFGYDSQAINYGSTAIGHGAVADRDYAVAVGKTGFENQLIHLADGTQDTDAVNLRQMRAAIAGSAFDPSGIVYAFGGGASWSNGMLTLPNYVIQENLFHTVGDALGAINGELTAIKARADLAVYYDDAGKGSVTLEGVAEGGEGGEGGAPAGEGGTQVKNVADAVDPMDAVNKRQMDAGDAATLASANEYTDNRETAIRTDMTAGDAATLASANAYTDTTAAQTLSSANAYTDGRFTELNDRFVQFQQQTELRFAHTDRRIDRQGAMGSAMLNMAINASGTQSRAGRVAVGVGWQGGESALSIGYGKRFGKTGSFSLGGAISHGEKSAGMGVGFDL